MKKKILIMLILALSVAGTALAQNSRLAPGVYTFEEQNPKASKYSLYEVLPAGDWREVLASVIQIILGITGSLALIAFTVGGVMLVTAQGNEERISKGKDILFWSILALAVIAASYGIVIGVSQLQFFQ